MLTRRLTPFLLLACALFAPATARADSVVRVPAHVHGAHLAQAAAAPDPTIDPQVAHWLATAQAFWGATPNCPGGINIQRAQWLTDPNVWAAAVQGGCSMAFDPDFYPAPAGYDQGWYQAAMCSVVAHEWGHLLGYGHAADPNSLMSPITPINIVGGCPTWGIPTAMPAPAPTAPVQTAKKTRTRKRPKKKATTCAGKAKAKSRGAKRAKALKRCKAARKRAKSKSKSRR